MPTQKPLSFRARGEEKLAQKHSSFRAEGEESLTPFWDDLTFLPCGVKTRNRSLNYFATRLGL
jgi:hypothetical protein